MQTRVDSQRPAERLACQTCQRRKVRCDRDLPCSTCRASGRACVPTANQRLPRGRAGGRTKDADLHGRIERLEGLIKTYHRHQARSALHTSKTTTLDTPEPVEGNYQFLGTAFWTSLQDELTQLGTGLQDVNDSPGVDETLYEGSPPGATNLSSTHLDPLFGNLPGLAALQHPLPLLGSHLCDLYFTNVDPVFKVLHAPSVRAYMQSGQPYLGYGRNHEAITALVFVIYYAAVYTMSEEECTKTLWQPRLQAVDQFRNMAETALSQANYVVSEELTTLQAFVVFLAIQRHEDRSRRTWTSAALAVRVAMAIGLQREFPGLSTFDTQQRRRTWHSLCILDLSLAVDLASDRLITPMRSVVPLAMNIDDREISYDIDSVVTPRIGWTDMSFSLMMHEIAEQAYRSHTTRTELWEQRQQIIRVLEKSVQSKYLQYCDLQLPLHAFAVAAARSTIGACHLHALRGTSESTTGAKLASVHSENVLLIAVNTLEYAIQCDTDVRMMRWRWILWLQWHAIAIAFASMTSLTTGPLADRAWDVVVPAFRQLQATVGNGQRGQMCRPLAKLEQRAREARRVALGTEQSHAGVLPSGPMADSFSDDIAALFAEPVDGEAWGFLSDFSMSDPNVSSLPAL